MFFVFFTKQSVALKTGSRQAAELWRSCRSKNRKKKKSGGTAGARYFFESLYWMPAWVSDVSTLGCCAYQESCFQIPSCCKKSGETEQIRTHASV